MPVKIQFEKDQRLTTSKGEETQFIFVRDSKTKKNYRIIEVLCDCGLFFNVQFNHIRSGAIIKCGKGSCNKNARIPEKSGVYKLTNLINNKIYIGKSVNLCKRISNHRRSEHGTSSKQIITLAIQKHKWENFKVEILEFMDGCSDIELLDRESFYIKNFSATNPEIGYNLLSYGNDCTGIKQSIEHIAKRAVFLKGRISPMKGRTHSEKSKKLMSEKFKIPVNQLDKDTKKFIKRWESSTDAAKFLTGDRKKMNGISQCCLGNIKSSLGFKWEYAECPSKTRDEHDCVSETLQHP